MAPRRPAPRRPVAPAAPAAPVPAAPVPAVPRPRNPNLSVADIPPTGSIKVQLTGALRIYDSNDGQSALICEVIVGSSKGPLRDLFLGFGRPDWIAARTQLGNDIGQWGGQTLTMVSDPTRRYANVFDPYRPAPPVPAPAWAPPSGYPAHNTAPGWPAPAQPLPPVPDDDIPF